MLARPPTLPGQHGVLRRRDAHPAAARRARRASCAPSTPSSAWRPGAEVTTEANPESVDAGQPERAAGAGADPDLVRHAERGARRARRPGPGAPAGPPGACAEWARAAGFEHVSLDLIYGTPGESDADWRRSLDAAVAAGPDHVSAYALTVEAGHPAGGAGPARRAGRAGRRRARRPLPGRGRGPDRGRLRLVRDLQLGRRRSAQVRAQHAVLDRRRLVGRSGPGRTATSAGPGGGTCGIRPPTARGSPPGSAPARPGRSCPRPNGSWSASCCCIRLAEGCPVGDARPGRARRTRRRWSPKAWPSRGAWPAAGSC